MEEIAQKLIMYGIHFSYDINGKLSETISAWIIGVDVKLINGFYCLKYDKTQDFNSHDLNEVLRRLDEFIQIELKK